MFKVPLADIKQKIIASGKCSAEEFEGKIKGKINELSGLISEEGAAHIIANELGVEVIPRGQARLTVRELYPGMRSISLLAKVIRKFDVREFAKGESTGKVCSMVVGDETGTVRVVAWNEQVNALRPVGENDIILVKEGYVRDNKGSKEMHLGEKSQLIVNPKGETVTTVRSGLSYERKTIADLDQTIEAAELLCTVVQVFDPRFFEQCSRCSKRVSPTEGASLCPEHGPVAPSLSYVLNLILDDGTGTIRGVFWKSQVEQITGKDEQQMAVYRDSPHLFEDLKTDLLGEQLKVKGRPKKNEMFDRLEFNVSIAEKANPEEELARLEGGR